MGIFRKKKEPVERVVNKTVHIHVHEGNAATDIAKAVAEIPVHDEDEHRRLIEKAAEIIERLEAAVEKVEAEGES